MEAKVSGRATVQLRQARTDIECATVVEKPCTNHCLCELNDSWNGAKWAVTITLNVHNTTRFLAKGQPDIPELQKSETMLVPNLRNQQKQLTVKITPLITNPHPRESL